MSLGGVLVLTSNNKDKQAGITVVVQEKREETREKRGEGWKRSSGKFELSVLQLLNRFLERDSIVDVQIIIVEVKNSYKFNLSFGFHCLFVSLCLQSQATQFQDQESASRPPDFTAYIDLWPQ